MPGIYKKIIILSLTILTPSFSIAQTFNKFSSKKEEFIIQLEKFLEKTSEEESEKIMAEFRAIWPMDLVTPKKEEKIYKQANTTYQSRLKN